MHPQSTYGDVIRHMIVYIYCSSICVCLSLCVNDRLYGVYGVPCVFVCVCVCILVCACLPVYMRVFCTYLCSVCAYAGLMDTICLLHTNLYTPVQICARARARAPVCVSKSTCMCV